MQQIAVIRLLDGRLAWYPPGASDEPVWLDNDTGRERLRASLAQRRGQTVFAAPGADVRLQLLNIAPEEKKHLARSLPFMLEERVAADVDDLHFASQALEPLRYAVAICSVDNMNLWQQRLAEFPGISTWIPEPLLLPWRQGEWCLVLEGTMATVRTGACEGFSVERDLLPAMLQAAQAQGEDPQGVVIYGQHQQDDTALLPESLQARCQWRQGNLYTAMLLSDSSQAQLNLLQGGFAPRLPLGRWWGQWRTVAAAFAVACTLHLAATWADYLQLEKENIALRTAIQDTYRQAYPRGAVADVEKQLQRQLDALTGSAESSGFVRLMEQVGTVIAAADGTSIATINYNDRAGELRLNIVAADYGAVEQIRAGINESGLEAVMESSSAQGDRVRARLRVGERS